MSEIEPPARRPGPWDSHPMRPAPARAEPVRETAPLEGPQNPVWAVISTLLLGGFLWWVTGTWVAALAGVFGLFVHEYGHVLAMNRLGMGPAHIHVVPFLGGLARGQRNPVSEWHGVLVSLAGPAFGLLAMIPFVAAWMTLGGGAWLFGAFFIAMINLVNLVPASPLDGSKALGPVLARAHPMLEKAVLVAVGGVVVIWSVMTGRWFLATFLAIAVIGRLRGGGQRSDEERPLTASETAKSLGLYLLTAAACAAATVAPLALMSDGTIMGGIELGLGFMGLNFAPVAGAAA
ncbi:metalloprotease [Brevundimonas sp.]|uniref:metalloprotease n=1 Tax=Brevundimonas sp. TaxID=1871086 RepID=UPI002FD87E5E